MGYTPLVSLSDRNLYDDGHLLVAAVRVLTHREGRPPSVEEAAALVGLSPEVVHHLVRRLEAGGIARAVETPFEARIVIEDHTLLEQLPRDETGPSVASEFESFRERQQQKQEELEKLFEPGALKKKRQEKSSSLEKQFKAFRDSRRPRPPITDESEAPERDEPA